MKFDYAHNALRFLIREFKIEKIYVPYYLCSVIRTAVFAEGAKPIFYHINDDFYPEISFSNEDYILYPNYFGVCDDNVRKLTKIYPKLIVDNAHSYYSPPEGLACFNSIRKFKDVKSGADLWLQNSSAGDEFKNFEKYPESKRQIYNKLTNKYKNINMLNIDFKSVRSPFCYPCLCSSDNEADKLAEELKRDGKIIYRYWDTLPENYNEYKFYRRLVPITIN